MVKLLGINESKDFSLKRLEKHLVPGNYCAITTTSAFGRTFDKDVQIFKVGEQKIVSVIKDGKERIGIHVQPEKNVFFDSIESVILNSEKFPLFEFNKDIVELHSGEVSHNRIYNEGTHSRTSGYFITFSGESIDSINLDQEFIKKEYKDLIKENELRISGIPFCLPRSLINHDIYSGFVPNIFMFAAKEVVNYLIQEGALEKQPDYSEVEKLMKKQSALLNALEKAQARSQLDHLEDLYYHQDKRLYELSERLSEVISDAAVSSLTLQAIHYCFSKSNFFETEDGFEFEEKNPTMRVINQDRVDLGLEKPIYDGWMKKRHFRVLPSTKQNNLMYAIPSDKDSAELLVRMFYDFNNKFFDKNRPVDFSEDFIPASLLPLEKSNYNNSD